MCKYENDYEYCIGIAHYRNGKSNILLILNAIMSLIFPCDFSCKSQNVAKMTEI